MAPDTTRTLRRFAAATLLAATAACSNSDETNTATTTETTTQQAAAACPSNNTGLTLPAGFCATIFADSVGHARHVAVSSDGVVYVTIDGTNAEAAPIPGAPTNVSALALRDTNNDGVADTIAKIAGKGNTGIAVANNFLYVDEGTRIVRYARKDGELAPAAKSEVVVSGLPFRPGHVARNFAIGSDGAIYVNIGSATNSCQVDDRENNSPGADPCTELRTRAGIWRFDAGKTNQTFAAANRFASGIRNAMGITIGPDGKLYTTQHGRDQLTDNWKNVFPDPKYQAENPGEEFMQVNEGDDFGWPYCYYAVDSKQLVTAPEYGGDGKKTDRCTDKKAPIASYPGHWAPMSSVFYTGSMFPAQYRNGVFIAFHGSWNRLPEPQAGYRVIFQPMSGAAANGEYATFADGFVAGIDPKALPGAAVHRPTGLAVGPDGALYITDDTGGRIYRVTYR
jgi:glucose/arabinose dehydrogenase